MGLTYYPEVLMARKVIKMNKLEVPYDLEKLVSRYAKIIFKDIPIKGVDGICLNLKTPGKTPKIIINNDSVPARQKFTLAHELGHIIIPWHLGTFIDDIDAIKINNVSTSQYWKMEQEANRFASELLVPFDWIYTAYKINPDYRHLISLCRSKCGISDIAASIRLDNAIEEIIEIELPGEEILDFYKHNINLDLVQKHFITKSHFTPLVVARQMSKYLSGRIAFITEYNGSVVGTGGTADTQTYYQEEGSTFNPQPYPKYKRKFTCNFNGINTHWWVLNFEFEIPDDNRSWKAILDAIVIDINPIDGADKFKRIVNGMMSGLNSSRKSKNRYTDIGEFIKEADHRFNDYKFLSFIKHKDFLIFIKKRSEAFFS